jgi:hypothetical protein
MITARLGAFFMLAVMVAAQNALPSKSIDSKMAAPKLPVIDHEACPGEGSEIHEKLVQPEPMYSSWEDNRRLVGSLKPGDELIVLAGVNVIRKPDIVLVKAQEPGSPFKPGDKVLRYGLHADRNWDIWSKGVWWHWSDEEVVEKGGPCGFGAFGQGACIAEVIENGVNEWWVQVKTASGRTGWVYADKSIGNKRQHGGDFADLCGED